MVCRFDRGAGGFAVSATHEKPNYAHKLWATSVEEKGTDCAESVLDCGQGGRLGPLAAQAPA